MFIKPSINTDKKDVKHNSVLSSSVQGSPAASVSQSRRNADDKKDGKSLSPSSAPLSTGVSDVIKSLAIDVSKIDPSDKESREAAEQSIAFLLGARNGIAGDLKRTITYWTGGAGALASFAGDTTGTDAWSVSAGSTSPLFALPVNDQVPSGNTIVTRLGRIIKAKHLTVRMWIVWFTNTGTEATYLGGPPPLRVTVINDKMPLAGIPTVMPNSSTDTDTKAVFLNLFNSNASPQVNAAFNPTTHGFRYDVLHDKGYTPASNAVAVTGAGHYACVASSFHEFHVPVDGLRTVYADDLASGTTTCVKNRIFIMAISDAATGTTGGSNAWSCYGQIVADYSFVDC